VGAKKKTSVGLLVFNSSMLALIFFRLDFSPENFINLEVCSLKKKNIPGTALHFALIKLHHNYGYSIQQSFHSVSIQDISTANFRKISPQSQFKISPPRIFEKYHLSLNSRYLHREFSKNITEIRERIPCRGIEIRNKKTLPGVLFLSELDCPRPCL
jgi:hypothetical protein